ncbi:MAG: hypothetical protein M1511_13740 [Deltaproteobacteria bacterium]|nr:hypothetical protein [Deltaproteobacteria bacterium]
MDLSVPLYRSSSSVPLTNYLSSFGRFKEVRLTTTLAYLMSQFPSQFKELFKIKKRDKILEVRIEYSSDGDRYDLLVLTRKKMLIIEAKIGPQQDIFQLKRYLKSFRKRKKVSLILLDTGSFIGSSEINLLKKKISSKIEINYVEWKGVHVILARIEKSKKIKNNDPVSYVIAGELKKYMEGESMSSDEIKEVYCRDLSGDSLTLFFKYHIYKCQSKYLKSSKGNRYFAPYFTRKAKDNSNETMMIDVGEGISYIAPILDMRQVHRDEVKEYLQNQEHYLAEDAAKEILRQAKGREMHKMLVFRLGEPKRVFLTPITKRKLKKGIGAMGSKSYTFRELFEALDKDR